MAGFVLRVRITISIHAEYQNVQNVHIKNIKSRDTTTHTVMHSKCCEGGGGKAI